MKRNESFSFNKSEKKNKNFSNKGFSNKRYNKINNNNYMRIKIESNREYNNKEIQKKNESIEGQPLKESFVSLSSKDAFNTSKNRANNNEH